jgi:hypothetical protein
MEETRGKNSSTSNELMSAVKINSDAFLNCLSSTSM